jgi:hypothetical protein
MLRELGEDASTERLGPPDRQVYAMLGLVAAMALLGGWFIWAEYVHDPWPDQCHALTAEVPGLTAVSWENDITMAGGDWYGALGDVQYIADEQPPEIADRLRADPDGYERVLATVDEEERADVEHLYALAVDPARAAAEAGSVRTDTAVRTLRTVIMEQCGWAP